LTRQTESESFYSKGREICADNSTSASPYALEPEWERSEMKNTEIDGEKPRLAPRKAPGDKALKENV